MSFFSVLRKAATKNIDDVFGEAVIAELRNFKVPTASIDDLFHKIEFKYDVNGKQLVSAEGNFPVETINDWFRKADLDTIVKELKLNVVVSGEMKKAMRSLAVNIPDVKMNDVLEKTTSAKRVANELDVLPGNTIEETTNAIGKKGVDKINKVGNKIKTVLGVGAAAAGVYAVWMLTDDLLGSLQEASKAAAGCYLVKQVNGKTTSCKLSERTCMDLDSNGISPCSEFKATYNYMAFVAHNLKNNIDQKDFFGSSSSIITSDEVSAALSDSTLRQNIINYYEKNKNTITNLSICIDDPAIEPKLSRCRACDTSADYNSVNYLDGASLADNFSIVCRPPSSLLENLVDVAEGVGVDILGTLGGLFGGGFFSYILYGGLAIIVIAILFMIFGKIKPKPKVVEQPQPQYVSGTG